MFKAIFWDNDGILVDTEPIYFEASRLVLEKYGVELTRDFYVNNQLKHNIRSFELLDKDKFDLEKLREEKTQLYLDLLKKETPVIDGVIETLQALHGKIRMGIVSSSLKIHFDEIMKAAKIKHYFDFFVIGEDVDPLRHKPHPDQYLKALKLTGVKPKDALAIEDTERGVIAAKAAGMTCFAVPTVLSKDGDFSKADKVLGNIRELIPLILNSNKIK